MSHLIVYAGSSCSVHIALIIVATLYENLDWLPPNVRMHSHWLQFIFKCIFLTCPPYLKQYFIPYSSSYSLRQTQYPSFIIPRTSRVKGRRAFQFKAPLDWNNLPNSLRSISIQFNSNSLYWHDSYRNYVAKANILTVINHKMSINVIRD